MSYSWLSADRLLSSLQERSKELRCFYAVEELLKNLDAEVDDICQALVQVIPHALQYPELGQVQIELADRSDLLAVGRAVGQLNKLLLKRQFIPIGSGRWGNRGDIKLDVSVTYSEINNMAALIEVARQKGGYVPDLSFGTHFFQDLVEARIQYLPLYPDDGGTAFNEKFLLTSPNILPDMLSEFARRAGT